MNNEEIEAFFRDTAVNIYNNAELRDPQKEGYSAIRDHFNQREDSCYVQLPVGCGKTGLIGITPFGVAKGRVLIISPNLTIRENIRRELNISDPACFYKRRRVFDPSAGPFLSELRTGANIHDCDAAHIIVANIQQFAGANNKWFEALPADYFRMILVDEGHHNVADTWLRLFEYFTTARVVSYTATPMRSDGQVVSGARVYHFGYRRSMVQGYISPIDAVYVRPSEITFTAEGETKTLSISDVMKMREKDWFSRGVAMSEECNRSVVNASVRQLYEARQHGTPRQIIAVACSIRHAGQVAALYRSVGLKVDVLHSQMKDAARDRIEVALRNGSLDVVVQVNILGEGYDLPTLSVGAVFRPYRSLTPYIQFVGRILRLAAPNAPPYSQANQVYLVSHVGLNDERWWNDFTNFDKDDQDFFQEMLIDDEPEDGQPAPRLTLRPFMRVLRELVESYSKKGYLRKVDDAMVQDLFKAIREKGFEPGEFGLTEEIVRERLQASQEESQVLPFNPIIQPQARRDALRLRLPQEARSVAYTVLSRLKLEPNARDFARFSGGEHNSAFLVRLALDQQNKAMGLKSGARDSAHPDQLQKAIDESANIVDRLTALLREKLKDGSSEADR